MSWHLFLCYKKIGILWCHYQWKTAGDTHNFTQKISWETTKKLCCYNMEVVSNQDWGSFFIVFLCISWCISFCFPLVTKSKYAKFLAMRRMVLRFSVFLRNMRSSLIFTCDYIHCTLNKCGFSVSKLCSCPFPINTRFPPTFFLPHCGSLCVLSDTNRRNAILVLDKITILNLWCKHVHCNAFYVLQLIRVGQQNFWKTCRVVAPKKWQWKHWPVYCHLWFAIDIMV